MQRFCVNVRLPVAPPHMRTADPEGPAVQGGGRAQARYAMPQACFAAMRAKAPERPALIPVKLLG